MRLARTLLIVITLVWVVLAGAARAAAAQDVGFEDLPGLETAISRTFTGNPDLESPPAPANGIREEPEPEVLLLLVAIYDFDTEASAASGYELLRTDTNATGIFDDPLPLQPIELNLDLPYIAQVAKEVRAAVPADFTLVVAQDGALVYSVIAITRGPLPHDDVAATIRSMAVAEMSSEPGTLNVDGTSTGGLWRKVPTRDAIDRLYRGVTAVSDGAPFPTGP